MTDQDKPIEGTPTEAIPEMVSLLASIGMGPDDSEATFENLLLLLIITAQSKIPVPEGEIRPKEVPGISLAEVREAVARIRAGEDNLNVYIQKDQIAFVVDSAPTIEVIEIHNPPPEAGPIDHHPV